MMGCQKWWRLQNAVVTREAEGVRCLGTSHSADVQTVWIASFLAMTDEKDSCDPLTLLMCKLFRLLRSYSVRKQSQ